MRQIMVLVTMTENLPILWRSRPLICFTSASAQFASQTICESEWRLRPPLDLSECISDENTTDESYLSRPDISVGKAGRIAAINCFTEPFESRSPHSLEAPASCAGINQ